MKFLFLENKYENTIQFRLLFISSEVLIFTYFTTQESMKVKEIFKEGNLFSDLNYSDKLVTHLVHYIMKIAVEQ